MFSTGILHNHYIHFVVEVLDIETYRNILLTGRTLNTERPRNADDLP